MKKIFALAALLLLFLPVFAGDFTVGTSAVEQNVCATDTALYVLTVQNGAANPDSYTIGLSGDAAKWAVAAPAGFKLESGEIEQVYIYVTPVSGALPGAYDLQVKVNGQESLLKVNVGDCHSAEFTAESTVQTVCADTTAEYSLTLANTGKYTETLALSLSGTAAKWATLSDMTVKLSAGQTKQIKVTATPPADQTGLLDLTVNAKAQNSNAAASMQLGVQSNNCYEFDLMLDKNYISFCENSEVKMPLTITNKGNIDNTFTISAVGPKWVSVEQEKLEIPAGGSKVTNLAMFPDYGIAGDFKIQIKAESEKGDLNSEQEITASVQTCHSTDLKIALAEDTLCPFTSKAYEVSLKNTGTFDERYAVKVSGADFATLDKNFVDVPAGKIESINLMIDAKDVPAGSYIISVTADAQDPSHAEADDVLNLKIAPKESCFGVQTTAALTKVQAAPGEGTLVPMIVENKGTEESTYNLEVSGTGAAYAKLNPAVVTIEGRQAKTAYLYIAVPEETARQEYMLTISARLADGTVSSSSNVVLDVVAPASTVTKVEAPTQNVQDAVSPIREKLNALRLAVADFFGKIGNKLEELKAPQVQEQPKVEIQQPEEAAPEPEVEENITEQVAPQEEVQEEVTEETGNVTQFLSPEAQKKLEATSEKNETGQQKLESLISKMQNIGFMNMLQAVKDKLNGIGPNEKSTEGAYERVAANANKIVNVGSAGGLIAKAKDFLSESTYGIRNWIWIAGIIIVLAIISYFLREPENKGNGNGKRKGMWGRFMDWLEEEDEVEQPVVETKPESKIKANDILKEVEKEQKEKKAAPKKKPKVKRY